VSPPSRDKQFASPSEFLEEIRLAFAVKGADVDLTENEMHRLTNEDMMRLGIPPPDPRDPYGLVIENLVERVSAGFQSRYQVDPREGCAFGALEHPSVNARCFRSSNGLYAIVIQDGLMNLLHKRTKLLTAALDPSTVVYCNRKPTEELTSQELREWAHELGEIYRVTGVTKGAMVKLKSDASASATHLLTMCEAFVLGHEIGHMVAGHMQDDSLLVADEVVPWLHFLPENAQHKFEFEADDYGFSAMEVSVSSTPKPLLLAALLSIFTTMSLIGMGYQQSETHPGWWQRVQRAVARHFSLETAELIRRWIDERDEQAGIAALDTAH